MPLEGDTVFESPRGHHFPVFKRDELDGTGTEGARGHLTEVHVGEDTRSHPGGVGALTRLHVIGRRIHHALVSGVLDRLVGLDRGEAKPVKALLCLFLRGTRSTMNCVLGQLGGRRGVDNADVDP